MKAKKNPKVDLNNYTKLFLLLGLVVSLLAVEYLIEVKTYKEESSQAIEYKIFDKSGDIDIPETRIEIEPPKQITAVIPEPVLDDIKIISDDEEIEETVIETTEMEADDAVEVIKDVVYADIKEEEIVEEVLEDVPFFVIEKVPVYPGCTGNNDALRQCMQLRIKEHVAKNFNVDLAQDLGLNSGKKRIFVMFVIDRNGDISGIRSRAPHKRLQIEAERVIKSLPKMEPGKQRGRAVGVKYSLPIVFDVQ